LFAVACARRIAQLLPLPAESTWGVNVLESFADGLCDTEAFSQVSWYVEGAAFMARAGDVEWSSLVQQLPAHLQKQIAANPDFVPRENWNLLTSAASFVDSIVSPVPCERRWRDWQPSAVNRLFQPVSLVHEVFGNPYRLVKFRKAWRTDITLSLA